MKKRKEGKIDYRPPVRNAKMRTTLDRHLPER